MRAAMNSPYGKTLVESIIKRKMNEFNEAVARVPALWGRKVVSVLEVSNGMASVRVSGNVHGFWVPVSELERVGSVPARTVATRQPRKRSEVC